MENWSNELYIKLLLDDYISDSHQHQRAPLQAYFIANQIPIETYSQHTHALTVT